MVLLDNVMYSTISSSGQILQEQEQETPAYDIHQQLALAFSRFPFFFTNYTGSAVHFSDLLLT